MAPRPITRVFNCDICRKPTSRLLGVGAGVVTHDTLAPSLRTAVLGYCGAHRDDVLPRFVDALALAGNVQWVSDPPVELRPAQVDAFLATVDRTMGAGPGAHGAPPPGEVDLHSPPENCPHCSGRLSWDTGPHVADAALRTAARAWECPSCNAAGLLSEGN